MFESLGKPRKEIEDLGGSTSGATTTPTRSLSIEVRRTGGYGEDEASIRLTDDNGVVFLMDLSIRDVEQLALMLGRHIPYATASIKH